MSFGAQFLNPSGDVLIDGTYRNLLRVAAGSWVGGNTWTQPFGMTTLTWTSQTECTPLIALQPAADNVYVSAIYMKNNQILVGSTGNFNWAVYGLTSPQLLDGTQHGVQVFSDTGAVIFDSRYEPVRIQQALRLNQLWPDYLNGGAYGQFPAYPYTLPFSAWGSRPFIAMNGLTKFDEESGGRAWLAVSGSNIILRFGGDPNPNLTHGFQEFSNNGSNGYFASSLWLGYVHVPLLRRDSV